VGGTEGTGTAGRSPAVPPPPLLLLLLLLATLCGSCNRLTAPGVLGAAAIEDAVLERGKAIFIPTAAPAPPPTVD